jgi:hypothetical protein
MRAATLFALFTPVSFGLAAGAPDLLNTAGRVELTLERAVFVEGKYEISGAAAAGKDGDDLLLVSDEAEDHYVYKTSGRSARQRMVLAPLFDLRKLDGFAAYEKRLQGHTELKAKDRRLDLEGLAVCGPEAAGVPEAVYLANERAREVLKITGGKRLEVVDAAFAALPGAAARLAAGGANAGIEGIAVDCAGQRLFIAKERQERALWRVDLRTGKVEALPTPPPSERGGQKVIDPETGHGLFDVGADIADLYFDQQADGGRGALYALERNTYEILKLDPANGAPLARVSYFKTEQGLYETGEPFGQAEALVLTPKRIIVGLDNNGTPLTKKAKRAYDVKGDPGAVFYFRRPDGF